MPWQVQVALNVPPFPHRPGMHHLDGAPPGPDGRPGTFTMLAGVLMSDQRGQDAGNLWGLEVKLKGMGNTTPGW